MNGYVVNIEKEAEENNYFRKVLYTDARLQLDLMSLNPGEEIGAEVHQLDQFFRIEEGAGKAVLEDTEFAIGPGSVVIVPTGTKHNIINTGPGSLKLYTLYVPPNHPEGTIHKTRAEAEAAEHA